MLYKCQDAYNIILDYIKSNGGAMSEWYVGIAFNSEERLFNDHNVRRDSKDWIHFRCLTSYDARTAEKALHDIGCDGASGGGDVYTNEIYAYRKTRMTNP
jgi:hypothetical protein